jgi:glycosyltransferase involved in cell wall biosynthesis
VIFVNIACYRDPECEPTIRDLFQKARYPNQINVGVVLQVMPSDGITCAYDRVQVCHVPAAASRGACWARSLGYQLWRGESHVLQIDSHMRFAPGWDVRLLAQLQACPSPKALLTSYPPGYEPPDHMLGNKPAFLAAKGFDGRGMLVQQGLLEPTPRTPKPTAFIAAGFLFGSSDWIREVPYDHNLYFHGEETTLAVRLWTNGWDFFGPAEALIWHQYTKVVRPLHWGDNVRWDELETVSLARMRHLVAMQPGPTDPPVDMTGFGLGSLRSLQQYQQMSGIDFRAQTIAPHALVGEFDLVR